MSDSFYIECCPFCGPQQDGISQVTLGETRDMRDDYILGYVMHCPECEYEMHEEFLVDLLNKWNTRK
jgi:hypothetical protein